MKSPFQKSFLVIKNNLLMFIRLTTWLVSHCRAYSAREDYVDILKKFTNVEVFGKCNEKPYNSDTDTLLGKYAKERFIDLDKLNLVMVVA